MMSYPYQLTGAFRLKSKFVTKLNKSEILGALLLIGKVIATGAGGATDDGMTPR